MSSFIPLLGQPVGIGVVMPIYPLLWILVFVAVTTPLVVAILTPTRTTRPATTGPSPRELGFAGDTKRRQLQSTSSLSENPHASRRQLHPRRQTA